MKVLVTGASGFVAGYLIEELLSRGHTIIGIDNFSKYGKFLIPIAVHIILRYHLFLVSLYFLHIFLM